MRLISPSIIAELQRKSHEYGFPDNSWEGYAQILRYVNEVAARVPSVAALAATDENGMTDLFGSELDQLGEIVMLLFKRGGLEEFTYYLPDREVW